MPGLRATLDRTPHPAASYEEALERVRRLQAQDATSALHPRSHTRLFGPGGAEDPGGGQRTARVYVCFHGLTNSPQQYVALGERLVARGDATVFIPRIPRHGFADRMTTVLAQLTDAELVDATADALDIAAGLADEVIVTGISLGGVLATWAAQFRPVARAAIVAPSFGLPILPPFTIRPLTELALRLGNRYFWWDPRYKQNLPGPDYAYPRFATHALAHIQRLGLSLVDVARTTPPAARSVWVVTNAADLAVSNPQINRLAEQWRRLRPTGVQRYQFPRRLRLFHDIVDPQQPYQKIAITHPALEQIIADGVTPTIPGPTRQAMLMEG
jgi:alpha-beta hydrolase superfamily lysophospholipase